MHCLQYHAWRDIAPIATVQLAGQYQPPIGSDGVTDGDVRFRYDDQATPIYRHDASD